MTLDDIRNSLKLRLRQSGNITVANQLFEDPDDYYDIINDTLITLAQETRTPQVYWELPNGWPVQNPPVREIKLSPSLLQVSAVLINGQRMYPKTPDDLDGINTEAFDATWRVYVGDTINPLTAAGQIPIATSPLNADQVYYYVRQQDRLILGLSVAQTTAVSVVIYGVSINRLNQANDIIPYGLKWKNWIVKEAWKEILLIIGSDAQVAGMTQLTEIEHRRANKDIHLAQGDKSVSLVPMPYRSKWRQGNIPSGWGWRGSNGRPYGWGP